MPDHMRQLNMQLPSSQLKQTQDVMFGRALDTQALAKQDNMWRLAQESAQVTQTYVPPVNIHIPMCDQPEVSFQRVYEPYTPMSEQKINLVPIVDTSSLVDNSLFPSKLKNKSKGFPFLSLDP